LHSGAAFSTYAALPYADLEITQGQEQLRAYEVSEGKKHFCDHCGTPLFNLNNKYPSACMIYLGTLENAATLTPKLNVWCESQLDWIDRITSIHSCAQAQPTYTQQHASLLPIMISVRIISQ